MCFLKLGLEKCKYQTIAVTSKDDLHPKNDAF